MSNAGVIEGQDLVLYIDVEGVPTPVAHSTSHTLEPTGETRQRISKETGKWKSKVMGLLEWVAGCEALTCYDGFTYKDIFALYVARRPVKIQIAGRDAVDANDNWTPETVGDTYFEGDALIAGIPLTMPNNEDSTFSISFEGTGELKPLTVTV